MVRTISDLEQEFEEAESQRQESDVQKTRKQKGLPISEGEKVSSFFENYEIGAQYKQVEGLVNSEKLIAENTKQLETQATQIREQATEIGQLQTQIKLMKAEIASLKRLITDFIQRIGQNPELERETLTNVNQYLKNWL